VHHRQFDYDLGGSYNAADPLSKVFIHVSPLALWELRFAKTSVINTDVDMSAVTAFEIRFTGSAVTMQSSGIQRLSGKWVARYFPQPDPAATYACKKNWVLQYCSTQLVGLKG